MPVVKYINGIYDLSGNDIFNEVTVVDDPTIEKGNTVLAESDNVTAVKIITPISSAFTRDITFLLNSGRTVEYQSFQTSGTVDVIYQGNEQTWNFYTYFITSGVLSDVALLTSSPVYYTARFREQDPLFYGSYDTAGELPLIATDPTLVEGNYATVGTTTFTSYEYDATLDQWDDLGFLKNQYAQTVNTAQEQLTIFPVVRGSETNATPSEIDIIKNQINDLDEAIDQILDDLKQQDIDGNFEKTNDDAWSSDKRIDTYLRNEFADDDTKDYAFNSIDFNKADANSGLVSWNTTEETTDRKINANVTIQDGRELLKLGRNTSGVTITNGQIVAIIGSVGNVAEIELVDVSDADQSFKVIGIATEDILDNSVGNVTLIGRVRGLDTSAWAEGTILYASETNGELTNICPPAPNRCILVAVVETSNAGNGVVWCWPRPVPHLSELSDLEITSPQDNDAIVFDTDKYVNKNLGSFYADKQIQNGQFKESFDLKYDSGTSTFILTKNVNDPTYATAPNELTMQFSTGEFTLNLPVSIAPTFGTTTTLQDNWLYIPISTKVLTKSISFDINWANEEHIRVAFTSVLDEARTDSEGAFVNQNWNNHASGTDYLGALQHIRAWIRAQGGKFDSGVAGLGNNGYLDDSTVSGTWYWKSSSGLIWQLHPQTFMSHDTETTDDIHIVNDFTAPYKQINTFNEFTNYSDGSAIGNEYFNIVMFGVANKGGEYSPLLANVPTEGYNTPDDAINDVNNTAIYELPRKFFKDSSTAFTIARITMQKSGANYNYIATTDLRDANTVIGGGGGASQDTEFFDSVFRLLNTSDSTKRLAFDLSGLSTSTTRTLSPQDKDYTIADHADVVALQEELIANPSTQVYTDIIHSTFGTINPIELGSPLLTECNGLTLNQLVVDGDNFATSWLAFASSNNVVSETLSNTGDGSNASPLVYQTLNIINANKYFYKAKVRVTNSVCQAIKLTTTNSTTQLVAQELTPTQNQWYDLIGVFTGNGSDTSLRLYHQYSDSATANGKILELSEAIAIPIDNTPYALLTASQINTRLGTYIEGITDLTNPQYKSVGKNMFGDFESGSLNTDGSELASDDVYRTLLNDIQPNTTYNMHFQSTTDIIFIGFYFYDSEGNFLSRSAGSGTSRTATSPTNAYKVRYLVQYNVGTRPNENDFINVTKPQVEEGTSATDYTAYKTNTQSLIGTFRSVGSIRDKVRFDTDKYVVDRYVGVDTTVVKSATSWTPRDVLTNTQIFAKDLTGSLDYALPDGVLGQPNITLRIGTVDFTVLDLATVASTDTENLIGISESTGELRIRVNKTTYPNSASFEAYLQANDVTFYYEYDTPLLSNEEIDSDGDLIQDDPTTIIQEQNLATETDIEFNLNQKAQNDTNLKNIQKNQREIKLVEDDIGDVSTLDTANKVVVGAINELHTEVNESADNIQTNANDIATLQDRSVVAFTGSASISSATSEPASNITLSANVTDYDWMQIVFKDTSVNYITTKFDLNSLTTKKVGAHDDSMSTDDIEYMFLVKQVTATTLATWYGVTVTTTYGSPANVVRNGRGGMTVEKVILGNY